jgi:hypothetical protein
VRDLFLRTAIDRVRGHAGAFDRRASRQTELRAGCPDKVVPLKTDIKQPDAWIRSGVGAENRDNMASSDFAMKNGRCALY